MNYYNIVLYCLCIFPVLCYMVFYTSRRRLYGLATLIPGVPGVSLLGNTVMFFGNALDISNTIKNIGMSVIQIGGILKFWLGPELHIVLSNPVDVEIVLNTELNKAASYRFLHKLLGTGLITAEVPVWKIHRKMLSPTFNQKILDTFIEIFVEKSEILVNQMSNQKGTFDITNLFRPCAVDAICATALGIQLNAQKTTASTYIESALGEAELVNKRLVQWWLHPTWIYKFTPYAKQEEAYVKNIHGFVDNVIQLKKQKRYNTHHDIVDKDNDFVEVGSLFPKRKAFLDLLIEISEGSNQLTDEEMRDEVNTIIIAGSDSTTISINFILLLLGSHSQIQDKVFDELDEIFGDSSRSVEKEDLSKMMYMERVIKESLRLFPVGSFIERQLKKEIKLKNYTLPAGSGCLIAIFAIHRDKNIWGDKADEFDPDNFLPEKCAKRHPYSFIPFSAGPRNCIGKQFAMMSLKVTLSSILRSFKVHCALDHKITWEKEIIFEILTRTLNGIPISIEPRSRGVVN